MKMFNIEQDEALSYQTEDCIWCQCFEYTTKRETAL